MSRTDLISDAFTVIRNASKARKEEAYIPYSNALLSICDILKREGYLENYKEIDLERFKQIKVYLRYEGKKEVISTIKKVSKPGHRVYRKHQAMRPVLRGYGIAIVSTSSGIFTDREARAKGIGGEVIGEIW